MNIPYIEKIKPQQAAFFWELAIGTRRMGLSDLEIGIMTQQCWDLVPYISQADGEIERLEIITLFLSEWAQAMAAYTAQRREARKIPPKGKKKTQQEMQDERDFAEKLARKKGGGTLAAYTDALSEDEAPF
jgi:hypothetical protein